MICELCGRYINEGVRIEVEGSHVVACSNCAGYGKVVETLSGRPKTETIKGGMEGGKKEDEFDVKFEEELIENYSTLIRESREKMGLKQEELARTINEPASVVHRIESGRIIPNPELVKKLERKLKVKLRAGGGETEVKSDGFGKNKLGGGVTLGDLVVIRRHGVKK